jgi:tyrosyl-tRNA synthetase
LSADLPTVEVPHNLIAAGITARSAFVTAGLSVSLGEARRAIANNALMINDVRVMSDTAMITEKDITAKGVIKLSLGRKRHVLLKPV